MNRALAAIDVKQAGAFASVAHAMGLANLELRASEMAAGRGEMLAGLFPVPLYQPSGGYRIDPSVILAFIRAESRFKPEAASGAGAKGLMQLMPATASHISGGAPGDLSDPSNNMAPGPDLSHAPARRHERQPRAGRRLLQRRPRQRDALDGPQLLQAERSAALHGERPGAETRTYIKRLLMYQWLYERRLGRDNPTLDQTAQGAWPRYVPTGRSETVPQPKPVTPGPQNPNPVVSDASY